MLSNTLQKVSSFFFRSILPIYTVSARVNISIVMLFGWV